MLPKPEDDDPNADCVGLLFPNPDDPKVDGVDEVPNRDVVVTDAIVPEEGILVPPNEGAAAGPEPNPLCPKAYPPNGDGEELAGLLKPSNCVDEGTVVVEGVGGVTVSEPNFEGANNDPLPPDAPKGFEF